MAKAADGSARQGSKSTELSIPMVQAAARGLQTITGADTAWMGPSNPLQATVPSAAGRQYDYPVAVNLNLRPRSEEAIGFGDLRQLADAYYLVRLAIETRKDQLVKMKWVIKPADDKKKPDARCKEIEDFFKMPDKRHNWQGWIRQLMEELLVTDAPTLYYRPNLGGKPYAFELMDGATIKVLLDVTGRTPIAPDPAYQQNLKGIPAINYTTSELIYRPRNPRVWKAYGMSPVEQIIMVVNIGLRREISQLQFYTEGNIPEAIIGTPNTWNPDQIQLFQKYWDSLFEGNTGSRRHAKFVPGGMDVHETKTAALTDAFDEWLARVVCYAFSLPPTAFVKQVNRATADNAKEQAEEEGLVPLLVWVEDAINYMIKTYWGFDDVIFSWEDEKSIDPLVQAQIDQIYLNTDVLDKNEVRSTLGLEARDYDAEAAKAMENNPAINPDGSPVVGNPDKKQPPKGGLKNGKDGDTSPPAKKDEDSGSSKADLDADVKKKTYAKLSAANVKIAKKLAGGLTKFFDKVKPEAITQIVGKYEQVTKRVRKSDDISDSILSALDLDFEAIVNITAKHLKAAAAQGAQTADDALQNAGYNLDLGTADIAEGVGDYRAAEMVGMRYDSNGLLVLNPNAEYRIDDATRELLAGDINKALQEGWSTATLESVLEENYAFSDTRAEVIARTEVARADMQGSMETYRASGVVDGKKWLLAEDPCPICEGNADEGVIDIDEDFSSGDDAAPAHPNCECTVTPIIKEQEGE